MFEIIIFIVFYFGCVMGSFLNVVILRLPNQQALNGRSHCLSCGHNLQPGDLIPLFSYIFLRGKCAHCGNSISPRYFFIELATGLLFAFAYWQIMPNNFAGYLLLVKACAAICVFVCVFVIDFEHFLILDSVLFVGSFCVLLLNITQSIISRSFFTGDSVFLQGLLGSALTALPFFAIWFFSKGKWMGFGDVKFCVFLGLLLGFKIGLVSLFLAVILGGFFSIFLLLSGKKNLQSRIPFGTFLSIAGFLAFFYGQSLLTRYLDILGY